MDSSGNNFYTLSNSPVVEFNVCDGRATGARAIPVTQENHTRFNTYANTADGLARRYKLVEDITLPAPPSGQSNWTPIGGQINSGTVTYFNGIFDGQGKTITGLTINNTDANFRCGMFGTTYTQSALIQNLGLRDVSISVTGAGYTAGLVGVASSGSRVEKCFVTGSVISNNSNTVTGGVVGYNDNATVQNCYSTANVSGYSSVGGVAGFMNSSNARVQNCYATGSVTQTVGGTGSSYTAAGVIVTNGGTVDSCVALNSSISGGWVGRVKYGGVTSALNNYGKDGITMTWSGGTYTPNNASNDGTTTTAWNTETFWSSTVGWDMSTIWQWSSSLARPVLRGFTIQP
jgi:hypothetical protein